MKIRYSGIIYQISLASVLTAIAVIIGAFVNFKVFGGTVYLVGIVICFFPLFLRIDILVIATTISVVLTDLYTGWIIYTWISIIAYTTCVLVIWGFKFFRFKTSYLLGAIIGTLLLSGIYFGTLWIFVNKALAFKTLWATLLQLVICVAAIFVLYTPMKILSRLIV